MELIVRQEIYCNSVVVVLAVDEGHEALLAGKGLVDEQILFIVAHRVADIHCLHCPTVMLELHIE